MRLKITLVLLLANLAVFFLLWRLDRQTEEVLTPSGPLTVDMVDLDQVQISGRLLPDGERVLVRDHDGNWHLTEPVQWPANIYAVQTLINQLEFLEQEASFPAGDLASSNQTLADYGLADPGLTLTLSAGTHHETLLVGAPTKLGGRLYIMNPADQMVRVVPQELLQDLILPMTDLRNDRIFTLGYFEIQQLAVRGTPPPDNTVLGAGAPSAGGSGLGAPKVTLIKTGDQWRLDTPVQCPADTKLVSDIVAQLDALTVTRFLPKEELDPARQGLTNPSMRVTLTGSSGSQTLLLGQRVSPTAPDGNLSNAPAQYYAQLEDPSPALVPKTDDKGNPVLGADGKPVMVPSTPPIFTVAAEPFGILQNAQESLRERKFLPFDPAAVSAASLQFGNDSVKLQKSESGLWQILPGLDSADPAVVGGLLDNLQKLEAVSFASDEPSQDDLRNFGLDDPQRTVTLQTSPSANLTFSLGVDDRATPVRYYIKVGDQPFVYEVGPAVLGWLRTDPLYYHDRVLEALPDAAQIRSLKLVDLLTDQTVFDYALDAQNTTWEAVLAAAPEPMHSAVLTLEKTVRNFKVASYLQGNFTAQYGLDANTPTPWTYRLEAGINLPGANPATAQTPPWICYFSERLGGTMQLGGTPQPPMIFTLTQPVMDALNALTLARAPPAVIEKGLQEMTQPIDARSPPAPAAPANPAPAAAPAAKP